VTGEKLLGILAAMALLDAGFLALAQPHSGLAGFGARGLVIDVVFGTVILILHIREGGRS
jgi:hypothetical protein